MNTLLLLVVTLASVSLCSAGSRGNWASGATADRDPEAPSPDLQPPKGPEETEAGGQGPSTDLQPPKVAADTGAAGQAQVPRAVAYAQAGRPYFLQGPDAVQLARATASGSRPATATYSARRGNTKYSVATASTIDGDVNTAAVA